MTKGEKRSKALKGRPASWISSPKYAEICKKISLAKRGKKREDMKGNIFALGYRHSAETKKKIAQASTGENSYLWKGENAAYSTKHNWLSRNYGNPPVCVMCGKEGFYYQRRISGRIILVWSIQWSNNSGKYKRSIDDYSGRCVKCHKSYDNKLRITQHAY